MTPLQHALSQLSSRMPMAQLRAAYEEISNAYRSGNRILLTNPAQQLAYMQARMPATVAVLSQVFQDLPSGEINHLLDLGCGPGSSLWALSNRTVHKATCLDQALGLMKQGQALLELSDLTTPVTWQQADLTRLDLRDSADLVTLSYVLNELTPSQQTTLVSQAWDLSSQYLVLVEPGTPKGFMNIRRAREQLITAGAYLLAPCTFEGPCPMSEQDWCHFSTRLQRSKIHMNMKGSLPYEDEKYSYLIACKTPTNNRPTSRIVKHPKESKGMLELDLCNAQGLTHHKITKRDGEIYKQARKANWGDNWPK